MFQDLVRGMLHVDPQKRLSAEQVLRHPWICAKDTLPDAKLVYHDKDAKLIKVGSWLFLPLVLPKLFLKFIWGFVGYSVEQN